MNKKTMMTALLVAGALVAPAAYAGGSDERPDGFYCQIVDAYFGDWAVYLGCFEDDHPATDNDESDRSGRDALQKSDKKQRDGRDAAPPSDAAPGPTCLACGGQDTQKGDRS